MNKQFNDFFEKSLNPEQKSVVAPHKGVLLVCAGAGSGKTRVITARMAYLITNHGVRPHEIVALTFTNKAAKEMKERIVKFLGEDIALPYVGTFHSYCLRMLKSYAHLLPFSTFSLIDDNDQEKLVRSIINQKALSKKVTPKQVLSFISKIKNEATTEFERNALLGADLLMREIFELYEKAKFAARCFDFDDLLLEMLKLFQNNESFKKNFQNYIKHVLVDEYQDTNKVQHALLKAMTKNEQNEFALDSLCVVGDEDQSIYSWRGATVTNIIHFNRDYPTAVPVTIERNYRSVQPILHVANEIIQNNSFRNPKKLYSGRDGEDRVRLLTCASGYQEGEALAQFLKLSRTTHSLSEHAVLYRSHFQSRSLEEALIRHSIPYKIMGGIQFYDRLEIKDMLAYMRLIINPYDRIAFSRVINTPSRGLGDKFEELFYETWDLMPFETFIDVAKSLIEHKKITASKVESLQSFISVFDGLSIDAAPSRVLTTLIDRTNYYTYLKNAFENDEADTKKENLKELINGVLFFEERHQAASRQAARANQFFEQGSSEHVAAGHLSTQQGFSGFNAAAPSVNKSATNGATRTQATLEAFLEEVALLQEQMNVKDDTAEYVKLMTFHAAKGLEFNTVILTGVEEGILPSSQSLYRPETLEEERRLMYVGITRARERLLLMHTKYRYTYGQLTDQQPSRFLEEIPEECLPKEDCSYWKDRNFITYFRNWLDSKKDEKSEFNLSSHLKNLAASL